MARDRELMSETKDTGEKTLSIPSGKTLSLKAKVDPGVVRQNFSHGRTKQVVVEKVKRRPGPGEPVARAEPVVIAPKAPEPPPPPAKTPSGRATLRAPSPGASSNAGVVLRPLTEEQMEARARALGDAREREEEDRRRAEIEAKARAEREAAERAEREAAEARKREEDARRQAEGESKRRAEEEAKRRLGEGGAPATPSTPGARAPIGTPGGALRPLTTATPAAAPGAPRTAAADEDESAKRIIRRPGMPTKIVMPPRPTRTAPGQEKSRGSLTVTAATGERGGAHPLRRRLPAPRATPEGLHRRPAEGKALPRSGAA